MPGTLPNGWRWTKKTRHAAAFFDYTQPYPLGFLLPDAGAAFWQVAYRPTKEEGFTTIFIAINPCLYWCGRDESNTGVVIDVVETLVGSMNIIAVREKTASGVFTQGALPQPGDIVRVN